MVGGLSSQLYSTYFLSSFLARAAEGAVERKRGCVCGVYYEFRRNYIAHPSPLSIVVARRLTIDR